uniref:Uncharacterized protein n=1 Tax=Arion vulgaris TaxID=1028688 RepID=A0A0B7AKD3_9EUPU
MYDRMNGLGRGRLKRTSFGQSAKALIQDHMALANCKPKLILATDKSPPWETTMPVLRELIPGIQTKPEVVTVNHLPIDCL